jgi:formylglycine-generating enzyme required for sulfatase activity
LVLIEGGEFTMGSDFGAKDERPTHRVRLPSFYAATAPVTNAEYARFVSATAGEPARFADDPRFNRPAQPVVGVSWFEASAYCEWLTALTGTRHRLPTEAEREYAALGGLQEVQWPWSSTPDAQHPLAADLASLDCPHPPDPACANGYGLRCVAENVHEWCSDWYSSEAYAGPTAASPVGPPNGERKVARGGSWRHQIKFTRVTARASLDPSFRYNDFGFRVYADA